MTHEEYLQAVRDTLAAQPQKPSEPPYQQLMRMNNLKILILESSKSSGSGDGAIQRRLIAARLS
jgi:hypothetical protein